jgi:hypothetical protein
MAKHWTPKRILLAAVGVLLAACFVTVLLLSLGFQTLLRKGIESAGGEAIGEPVLISDIDLSLARGALSLDEVTIKNPSRYDLPDLLRLKHGQIRLKPTSLIKDTVDIQGIYLDGITLVIEADNGTTNVQEFFKRLPDPSDSDREMGKRLHIDELVITHAEVHSKIIPIPGKHKILILDLPEIRLEKLGYTDDIDTVALTGKILVALTEETLKQSELPDKIARGLDKTLEDFADISKTILDPNGGLGVKIQKAFNNLFRRKPATQD